jgi:thiol:disulfide interchange protein DsbD
MPAWFLNASRNSTIKYFLGSLLLLASAAVLGNPFGGSSQGSSLFEDGSEPRFLPVDEAFAWHVALDTNDSISVHWTIAPGYYLYREQFDFMLLNGNGDALEVSLPDGVPHNDAYFGDVEVYYQQLRVEIQLPDHLGRQFKLQIRYQGCAEAGLCYLSQCRELEIDR